MRRVAALMVVTVGIPLVLLAATPASAALRRHPLVTPVVGATTTGGASSATKNPAKNVAAKPSYEQACLALKPDTNPCLRETLSAIDHARAAEHVKRMILPDNYRKLSQAEQTFVISNLERVDRGLPPFLGLAASPNKAAFVAARGDTDPQPASLALHHFKVNAAAGNWTGNLGPLAADYTWMYDDGPGSDNLACPRLGGAGCWGHRENILYRFTDAHTLVTGVGTSKQRMWISVAQLFLAGNGKAPAMTYTWKQALAHGADHHRR